MGDNFFFRSPLEKNISEDNEQQDFFDLVAQNSIEAKFEPSVLSESNKFSATVLRVVTYGEMATNDVLAKRAKQLLPPDFDPANDKAVMVFARIDTIHSNLPNPLSADDEIKRQNLILLHPLFTGYKPESDDSDVTDGELIFVDFRHKARQNYTGPYYIGKVSQIETTKQASAAGSSSAPFKTLNGGAGLKSKMGGGRVGAAGPDGVRAGERVVLSRVISAIPEFPILHPLPAGKRTGSGQNANDQFPDFMNVRDPYWLATTKGTFEGALLRTVSGAKGIGEDLTFSRPPDSYISLDSVSIGIAHWWAETIPAILKDIAIKHPAIARWAWGDFVAERMKDFDWIDSQIFYGPNIEGKPLPKVSGLTGGKARAAIYKSLTSASSFKSHDEVKYNWLLSGWHEIGRHPEIIKLQARNWFKHYANPAKDAMLKHNFKSERMYAGLCRMANSGAGSMKSNIRKAVQNSSSSNEADILRLAFSPGYYDELDRLAYIENNFSMTPVNLTLDVESLNFLPLKDITRAGRNVDPSSIPDFVIKAKEGIDVFKI